MRKLISILAIVLLAVIFFNSCTPESIDLSNRDELTISSDTTWRPDNPKSFTGFVKVVGCTLTIEAGTTVKFGSEAGFIVGHEGEGTVIINGTAENPVIFVNEDHENGFKGVQIKNSSSSTLINHLIIKGARTPDGSAMVISKLNFPINGCKLINCPENGLKINSFAQREGSMKGLEIVARGEYALMAPVDFKHYLLDAPQIKNKDAVSILLNNDPASWPAIELPDYGVQYVVDKMLTIDSPTVTLADGITIASKRSTSITFGCYQNTRVIANGINFTAYKASTPGSWNGINCDDKVTSNSKITSCTFEYAEVGLKLLSKSPFTISNCTFKNNKTALFFYTTGPWDQSKVISNNTFTNNGKNSEQI